MFDHLVLSAGSSSCRPTSNSEQVHSSSSIASSAAAGHKPQPPQQQHPRCKPASRDEHSTKQQQQQQQHEFVLRCGWALTLMMGLLRFWQELLDHVGDCPSLNVAIIDTLPALVGLTTAAAPLVDGAKHISGSGSSKWVAGCDHHIECVGCIANTSIALAKFLAIEMPSHQAQGVVVNSSNRPCTIICSQDSITEV